MSDACGSVGTALVAAWRTATHPVENYCSSIKTFSLFANRLCRLSARCWLPAAKNRTKGANQWEPRDADSSLCTRGQRQWKPNYYMHSATRADTSDRLGLQNIHVYGKKTTSMSWAPSRDGDAGVQNVGAVKAKRVLFVAKSPKKILK